MSVRHGEPNLTREVHVEVKRPRLAGEPSPLLLLAAVILGPVAVLANMQAAYSLAPVVCERWPAVTIHVVHGAMLILAISAGLIAMHCWRVAGRDWPIDEDGPLSRSRFIGAVGVMFSALSSLVLVSQWIATFMLHPCQ
jgi:hypothetical protein